MSNFFNKLGAWFAEVFKDIQVDADKVAITITEDIQSAIKSGLADAIADGIGAIFPSVKNLPTEIVAELKIYIPKALAAELALQGLPTNPQPADIQAFVNSVLTAFDVSSDNSQIWSTLSANIYGLLQAYLKAPSQTFASLLSTVEAAYQDVIASQTTAS